MGDHTGEPFIQMIATLAAPAVVVSYLLCWLMRRLSPKLGYLDYPTGRKQHDRPMPMGGGVAVMAAMIVMIVGGLAVVLSGATAWVGRFGWLEIHKPGLTCQAHQIGGILLCALILHVLGIFDDMKNLGPKIKLLVQFAVAGLIVIGFGVRLYMFIPVPAVSAVVTILWIVIITNAFNFLDNADGLSAGTALICTSVLLVVSAHAGQVFVAAYLACFAGTLFGFLLHNFPPARIYLGDAGSLPVGFLLAVGSILTTYYHQTDPDQVKTAVLVPLVVMAIPLYDSLSVIVLRLRSGAKLFAADHRHFSHRLIRRGLSVRDAVLTVYLACGGTAIAAIVLRVVSWPYAILIFLQTACIIAIIALLEYKPANERNS